MENKLELFKEYLAELYPKDSEAINESLAKPPCVSFRSNVLVSKDIPKGVSYVNGPLKNSYILKDSADKNILTASLEYKAGQIYIQSLSSMLTVYLMNPQPHEMVLDLCAAPGSKTSLIAQLTNNTAQITAVENNRNRFFAMQKNLESLRVQNTTLLLENSTLLDHVHPEFLEHFDKVLADVPCTNEGLLTYTDPAGFAKWNPRTSKRLSHLQKGLLDNAIRMTKKGGTVIYSTCTYSPLENESVVDWALSKHQDMKIEKLTVDEVPVCAGFTEYKGKKLNPQVANALRILPNGQFTGFFIAKFIKN